MRQEWILCSCWGLGSHPQGSTLYSYKSKIHNPKHFGWGIRNLHCCSVALPFSFTAPATWDPSTGEARTEWGPSARKAGTPPLSSNQWAITEHPAPSWLLSVATAFQDLKAGHGPTLISFHWRCMKPNLVPSAHKGIFGTWSSPPAMITWKNYTFHILFINCSPPPLHSHTISPRIHFCLLVGKEENLQLS